MLEAGSKRFKPIEMPPDFLDGPFDFGKNRRAAHLRHLSPYLVGGKRGKKFAEEEIVIHKGENYKSKRTKPPVIRDSDRFEDLNAYYSDDNLHLGQKQGKIHSQVKAYALEVPANLQRARSALKVPGCYTARGHSAEDEPFDLGAKKRKER